MGGRPPYSPEPDVADLEFGLQPARHGLSAGQLVFDFLFGILSPLLLLVADPALFNPTAATRAALPPYWATPVHILAGCLGVALLAWLIAGPRHPRLGLLLAGPFALGALLSAALALCLLGFALTHADTVSGLLSFTPWLAAAVFAENCIRAILAASRISGILAGASTLFGSLGPLVAVVAILASRDGQARLLEGQLLSKRPDEFQMAFDQIRDGGAADFDRIALAYDEMGPGDPRRERIARAYLDLTGTPIQSAIDRLRPYFPGLSKPEPLKEAPETPEARALRLIDDLFADNPALCQKAVDELLGDSHVDFDLIVRRYARLPEADPRRARVEAAYRQLVPETIQAAVQRLEREGAIQPGEEEPRPATQAPTVPPPPAP